MSFDDNSEERSKSVDLKSKKRKVEDDPPPLTMKRGYSNAGGMHTAKLMKTLGVETPDGEKETKVNDNKKSKSKKINPLKINPLLAQQIAGLDEHTDFIIAELEESPPPPGSERRKKLHEDLSNILSQIDAIRENPMYAGTEKSLERKLNNLAVKMKDYAENCQINLLDLPQKIEDDDITDTDEDIENLQTDSEEITIILSV